MKRTSLILILLLSSFTNVSIAQCSFTALEPTSKPDESGYLISSQSRIVELKGKADYEMVFIAQNDVKYRVSLGVEEDISKDKILFDVFEMVVKKSEINGKVGYVKENHMLFENVSADTPIEFLSEGSRKLHIHFKKDLDLPEDFCVQVKIENKKKK